METFMTQRFTRSTPFTLWLAACGIAFFAGCGDKGEQTPGTTPPADDSCGDIKAGDACDDGNACTTGDVCTAGVCKGTALNCANLSGACVEGVCEAGECVAKPRADGTACDDGSLCTETSACTAGECVETSTPCDLHETPVCTVGACGEAGCEVQTLEDGTACLDSTPCGDAEGTCGSELCLSDSICAIVNFGTAPYRQSDARAGGVGGTDYTHDCPAGQVLIGFKGAVAKATNFAPALAQVSAICGRVTVGHGEVTVTQTVNAPATGAVGSTTNHNGIQTVQCPANQVVSSLKTTHKFIGSQNLVTSIELICASIDATRLPTIAFTGAASAGSVSTPPTGGIAFTMPCEDGRIPAGFTGRAGDVVDSFALRCAKNEATHEYLVP